MQSQVERKKSQDCKNSSVDYQVPVLYQRIGNQWFAFSVINHEVFFGTVPQDIFDFQEIV